MCLVLGWIWLWKHRQWTNNSDKFVEGLPEAHLNPTATLIANAIASKPDQNTMICCVLLARFWVVDLSQIAQQQKILISQTINVKVNPYTYQNRFFNFESMLLSSCHGWWLIVWVPNMHGFGFFIYQKMCHALPSSSGEEAWKWG